MSQDRLDQAGLPASILSMQENTFSAPQFEIQITEYLAGVIGNPIIFRRDQNLMRETGTLKCAAGLVISYINQDTSGLHGTIKDFCRTNDLDESLFCAILRQLDLERVQFVKKIEEYSEGQKKKVLIAASLLKPAHLYIWDEPLNYIDVFSRMQIENLILTYQPTMLIVEHDVRFREKIATRVVEF